MPRWKPQVTTLTYAGNTLLAPGTSTKTTLEDTEVEYTAAFNREWLPTISGAPYPENGGNDLLELPIPIITEYADAKALFSAAMSELDFARNHPRGSLSLSTTAPGVPLLSTLELAPFTDNQANFRYVHVASSALAAAAGCPCSSIAFRGGSSATYTPTPYHLAAYSTTEETAEDTTVPTLLAISTDAVACAFITLNRWHFSDLRLPAAGEHLRLALLPSLDATDWAPNSFPDLRAAVQPSDGSLGFISTGGNSASSAYFPCLALSYTYSGGGFYTTSFPDALLTSLSHRVTTAPHCLRLVSTWTFSASLHSLTTPSP